MSFDTNKMHWEDYSRLLTSNDMQKFVFACKMLVRDGSRRSFEIMKPYLFSNDLYKRRYVLSVIFSFSFFDHDILRANREALQSNNMYLIKAAVKNYRNYSIPINEPQLKEAILASFHDFYDELRVAEKFSISDGNYAYLVDLFRRADTCLKEEILSEILIEKYLPGHPAELFSLFSGSHFGKIRCQAVKIGRKYGFDCAGFLQDPDGHVRKLVFKTQDNPFSGNPENRL